MSEWPAFEKEDDPHLCHATEQELSWLLPQSQASLAGELCVEHDAHALPSPWRLTKWVQSVSVFHRHR